MPPVSFQHYHQHHYQDQQIQNAPYLAASMQQEPLHQWAPTEVQQAAAAPARIMNNECALVPPVMPLGICSVGELRPGITGSVVGLLPGLCPQIMDVCSPVRI